MVYWPFQLVISETPAYKYKDSFKEFLLVLICAGVVSLAYYITVLLEKENRHSYFIEVSFDYGFFTLSAAG